MNLKHYLGVVFKGICMGAADVVPGVSGGTIAFLMGIYQELIDSIRSVNGTAVKLFFSGKFAQFWKPYKCIYVGQAYAIFAGVLSYTYMVFLFWIGSGICNLYP